MRQVHMGWKTVNGKRVFQVKFERSIVPNRSDNVKLWRDNYHVEVIDPPYPDPAP